MNEPSTVTEKNDLPKSAPQTTLSAEVIDISDFICGLRCSGFCCKMCFIPLQCKKVFIHVPSKVLVVTAIKGHPLYFGSPKWFISHKDISVIAKHTKWLAVFIAMTVQR